MANGKQLTNYEETHFRRDIKPYLTNYEIRMLFSVIHMYTTWLCALAADHRHHLLTY